MTPTQTVRSGSTDGYAAPAVVAGWLGFEGEACRPSQGPGSKVADLELGRLAVSLSAGAILFMILAQRHGLGPLSPARTPATLRLELG